MAEIEWKDLTVVEAETLAELKRRGEQVFAAPIEIERDREARKMQFRSLGICWKQCRTWYIGSEKIYVHLTPANKEVHDFLVNELRAKHRNEYRKRRCMVPGKQKELILCPECNKCSECPFPEYRDKHQARELSWDGLIDKGYEGDSCEDAEIHRVDLKMELDDVFKTISAKNPLFVRAFLLKEKYGLTVDEIAERLNITPRNVYEYLRKAKEIGKKFQ